MNPTLQSLFGYTGIPYFARLFLTRQKRFVLMFHGVSSHKRPDLPVEIQPYLCRQDLYIILAWVQARFTFLSAEEFLFTDKPGVLLTFDDGFANNVLNAVPVLETFQAPAIFFVSVQHVENPKNWLPFIRGFARKQWGEETNVPENIASDFYDGMTTAQLRICARHPLITIGAHTWTHPLLTTCRSEETKKELDEAKRQLETIAGQDVTLFAYPTGDYNQEIIADVQQAGYQAAFVMDSKQVGMPRFEIPRIGLYASQPAYLALKLSGLHRPPLGRMPIFSEEMLVPKN